jgi:DHA2 family multidrug resistance protein
MSGASAGDPNRMLITGSIMLATIMTSLDTTIANVALPHMQGSVSASADQITWVLTSYIVAAAIVTPMTGWLAGRFGRKLVFLVSIGGFTLASALCGAAQSLEQIVLFRLLQGMFGAALIPLSQAVMLDIYPPAEQGPAMAIWGMGALLGPIVGPALGGYLTDNFSWRWVFYINLPFGLLAYLGVFSFIHDRPKIQKMPFDFMGFGLLSLAIGSFQLFLDRGQDKAWFESSEIWIEACVAGVAALLFAIHTATAERPFLPPAMLRDRNFVTSVVFGFFIGTLLFASLALLPPMLETLMGYPVVTTGLVTAPRGLGGLVSMFVVGRLINRIDSRAIIAVGLVLGAVSLLGMTQFDLAMGPSLVLWMGVVQGLGIGLVFIPLTTLGFATLNPAYRAEAAGVFTLTRNIGSSAGISVLQALHSRNTEVVHARLMEGLRPDNPLARAPFLRAPFSLTDPAGIAALNGVATRQASMVAYIDDFRLMFVISVMLLPLLLLMRPPNRNRADDRPVVVE